MVNKGGDGLRDGLLKEEETVVAAVDKVSDARSSSSTLGLTLISAGLGAKFMDH